MYLRESFAMRSLLCISLWSCIHADDQTSVTIDLNAQIEESTCGVYCGGGKGVMIRNPYDGYETGGPKGDWLVVPATFWHNDLVAANGVFPSSIGSGESDWGDTSYNVDCPNSGNNGFFDVGACATDPGTGENSPWRYASTGYIIGDAMKDVWTDWDSIQDADWGWGVFYPTDSNSVDFRCRWLPDFSGYDCPPAPNGAWPGGWIAFGSDWKQDDTKRGPGTYPAGNPWVDAGKGGGSGCHFDKNGGMTIDQQDAHDDNGDNLVQDPSCQCNYVFNDDWNHWVYTWVSGAVPKHGLEYENWLGKSGKKAPNRAMDEVSCWVSNLRDMINIQNAIWGWRWDWNNQLAPAQKWVKGDPNSFWGYWGWNEVPMELAGLTPHQNHQAVFIHLPSSICGNGGGDDSVQCLGKGQQKALENDLDNWVNGQDQFGYLVPGVDNIGERPGSYLVFVREWYDADNDRWRRYFFCENWSSPSGKYQIVFNDMTNGSDGACYLEKGANYHLYYGNATNVGQIRHMMDVLV